MEPVTVWPVGLRKKLQVDDMSRLSSEFIPQTQWVGLICNEQSTQLNVGEMHDTKEILGNP